MKKIISLFAAVLFAGSMMAESINIIPSDFKSSYQSSETTFTKGEVEFAYSGAMYNGKNSPTGFASKQLIQLRKSANGAGEIKNNTELNLKSIVVATQNDKAFTLSVGTTASSLSKASDPVKTSGKYACKDNNDGDQEVDVTIYTFDVEGEKFFDFLNGSNAQYVAYITIELGSGTPAVDKPTIAGNTEFEDEVEVTITAAAGATIYYTLDGTDPTDASTEYTTAFTLDETTTVKAIAKVGTDVSSIATKVFTKLEKLNCAGFAALENNATGLLDEFVVTYAAADGKNIWIKDASGALLIYYSAGSYGLKAGDVVKGMKGSKTSYQTKVAELVPSVAKTELNITEGAAPEPEELAVAPEETDINKYVVFKAVEAVGSFTEGTASNITIKIAGTDVTFRSNFKNAYTFVAGKKYDIVGLVSYYGSAVQVYFVSATESTATAIDETEAAGKATKELRNGQVLIIKGNKTYNILGQEIK